MMRFSAPFFLVIVLAFFQAYGFAFLGTRPNLVLAAFAAMPLFIQSRLELVLMMSAAILVLKSAPSDIALLVSLFATLLVVGEAVRLLRMHEFILVPLAAVLGSASLYIMLAPSMLFSSVFVKEALVNALMASGLRFALASFLSSQELKIRRE